MRPRVRGSRYPTSTNCMAMLSAFYSRADDMSINERMTSWIKSYNHCFGSSARNQPSTVGNQAPLSLTLGSLEISLAPYSWAEASEGREGGLYLAVWTALRSAPPLLPFSTFSKSVISLRFRRRRRLRDGEAANAFPPARLWPGSHPASRAWRAHADYCR